MKQFLRIDGEQWGAAFAFNAIFALFPMLILIAALLSAFIDRDEAARRIIEAAESWVPLDGDMRSRVFETIDGVIRGRSQTGAVAAVLLLWTSLACFSTMVRVTNHAWGDKGFTWWRLPLRALLLLVFSAVVVLVSAVAPLALRVFPNASAVTTTTTFFAPIVLTFVSLTIFYLAAPHRKTHLSEVWLPALFTTLLMQVTERGFAIYLTRFATLNAVYGVFGAMVALMLWIYLSGCVFVFGACLCSARADEQHAFLASGADRAHPIAR